MRSLVSFWLFVRVEGTDGFEMVRPTTMIRANGVTLSYCLCQWWNLCRGVISGRGAFRARVPIQLRCWCCSRAWSPPLALPLWLPPSLPPTTLHWPHQQSSVAAYTDLHNGMRGKGNIWDSAPKLSGWVERQPNSTVLSQEVQKTPLTSASSLLLPHRPPSITDGPHCLYSGYWNF